MMLQKSVQIIDWLKLVHNRSVNMTFSTTTTILLLHIYSLITSQKSR